MCNYFWNGDTFVLELENENTSGYDEKLTDITVHYFQIELVII